MNNLSVPHQYVHREHNLGDGAVVTHIHNFVTESDNLFTELLNKIEWNQSLYKVNDDINVPIPRLMNVINFKSSNDKNLPLLKKIKKQIEKLADRKFTYAVLNYYRDGKDHVGFHSDREVNNGQIVVSVSLGAKRQFILKHKFRTGVKHTFTLRNGDVLILNDAAIKTKYKHAILKEKRAGPRINITFRQ